jgi:hypothetical protein
MEASGAQRNMINAQILSAAGPVLFAIAVLLSRLGWIRNSVQMRFQGAHKRACFHFLKLISVLIERPREVEIGGEGRYSFSMGSCICARGIKGIWHGRLRVRKSVF